MKFSDLKIGTRLAIGFGTILMLTLTIAGVTLQKLYDIRDINHDMVNNTWVKANAITTIDTTTRANGRRNIELIANEATALPAIFERIAVNKKIIDDAFAVMEKHVFTDADRSALKAFSTARGKYVTSFQAVGELVKTGQVEAGRNQLLRETLPLLDALQAHVTKLADQQRAAVFASGQAADENINSVTTWLITLTIVALVLGILFAWTVTRSITRPIRLSVKIAENVAQGDLAQRINNTAKDETGQLLQALSTMSDNLASTVSSIRSSANAISSASGQIAAGNINLSARTEEQAASLEETAASMEEMASTVKQNTDNARQADQLAANTSDIAARGGVAVAEVVETMRAIHDSSYKISEIIAVIDSIAFQTNILALNAAVEAARAGEEGRGFAVVASEVRTLAQRSASAAMEIKNLIDDSVNKVNLGADQVERAGSTMQEIIASVEHVTTIMREISLASDEQALGVDQVNIAISQIDQVTQQNADLVEQAAAAAGDLQNQAIDLVQAVAVFKTNNEHIEAVPSNQHLIGYSS